MDLAITYFFGKPIWSRYLLRLLLVVGFYLALGSAGMAQQYTRKDEAEIKYLAQLTLVEYESLLNFISSSAIPETMAKEAIQNAYRNPNTKIFWSPDVLVDDNIQPSLLNQSDRAGKTIKDYISEFDLMYVKSDLETVDFYDFEISNLKRGDYPFIRIKYTVHFRGRHKKDPAPYSPVERLAELRAEKKGNRWVTHIINITTYDASAPIAAAAGDMQLDAAQEDDGTFTNKLDELLAAQEAQGLQLSDAAIAQSWQAFDDKRFKEIRALAERAEVLRDYDKASDYYAQALLIKPQDPDLKAKVLTLRKRMKTNELLASKYQAGDYVEAISEYSKAITEDPQNADFYYGRGRSYEQLNELQSAIQDFSTAIKLDNKFVDALSNRARLYISTAQPQKALEDYNQIIESLNDASAFYPERAKLKAAMGDTKGALADYDAAIKQAPRVARPYYEKGLMHAKQKQSEDAIAAFSKAIHLDSTHAEAYYARGMAYAENESISSAAVDFERARKLGIGEAQQSVIDSIAVRYIALGEEAQRKQDYKGALENFIKLVLLSPNDESAWIKKGDAHYQLQDYQNALQSYSKAVALDKVSLAYYKRALVHRELKDYAAAKSDFEKFIPLGWQLISAAESKAGNAKSSESLEEIAEEVAQGWYVLGNAQLMAEQYADANESFNKALDINKSYAKALAGRGAAQMGLRSYKKAIKDIEKSIKWGIEDTPWIYLNLGDAYQGLGQTDYAISIYTYLIESVDKNFDLAYIHRANSYKNIKQYPLALKDINTALTLNETLSRDVDFITSKGLVELYDSKFQEASQSFDQALSLENNDAWALYGKASVLASQNKLEESLDFYRQAFQTGEIQWSAIKDDPIIKHVSKQKAFKDLVDASLRL